MSSYGVDRISKWFVICLSNEEQEKNKLIIFVSIPWSNRRETIHYLFLPFLLSIPIIHHPNVFRATITIDISLRRTHISFDLDALLILPVIVLKQRERKRFNESLVSSGTTLTEYPTIFCPIKLLTLTLHLAKDLEFNGNQRFIAEGVVSCHSTRIKGQHNRVTSQDPLPRFVESSKRNFRSAHSHARCLAEDFSSLTATLFTFRRDTTYRLILIIAPRRRDASNRLPTLCRGESNCNWSRVDRPRSLHIVIPALSSFDLTFFLLEHAPFSPIFLIVLRLSSIIHRVSHSRLLFLANYLMLHPH